MRGGLGPEALRRITEEWDRGVGRQRKVTAKVTSKYEITVTQIEGEKKKIKRTPRS